MIVVVGDFTHNRVYERNGDFATVTRLEEAAPRFEMAIFRKHQMQE